MDKPLGTQLRGLRALAPLSALLFVVALLAAASPSTGATGGPPAVERAPFDAGGLRHVATHAVLPEAASREALPPAAIELRGDGFRLLVADNAASPPRVRILAPYPRGTIRERGYLLGHLSPVRAVAWSEDRALLATLGGAEGAEAERSLRLWNADAMNRKAPGLPLAHGLPTALSIAPNGALIAVGHNDGWVSVFRNRHGRQKPRDRMCHDLEVTALAFSRDGKTLYTATRPGAPSVFGVWRARDLRPLRRDRPLPVPTGTPTLLLAAPGDGAGLIVGDDAGELRWLELGKKADELRWTVRVKGAVRRVRPIGDSSLLLVCSEGEAAPTVLHAGTGEKLPTIEAAHGTSGLADAAYDIEMGLLALAHLDGVVEYWRFDEAPKPKQFR